MHQINKKSIRTEMLQRRKSLSDDDIVVASESMCMQLLSCLKTHDNCSEIALYYPINGEISPLPALAEMLAQGYQVSLPMINEMGEMSFIRWHGEKDELIEGKLSIPTPKSSSKKADKIIPDIILLPLVAFDKKGNRIGYGGGYYDKTIAFLRQTGYAPKLIGLGYDWQEIENIQPENHDVQLDYVVTDENGIDHKNTSKKK